MDKSDRYFLLFGGIVSLVLGILLFTRTAASLSVVVLIIGLTWFIQGVFSILSIFIDKKGWGWNLFGGVIGIAAGLIVIQNPVAGAVVLPAVVALMMGVFGLMIGISALIAAFQGEGWGAGIFGAISILLGLLLMFNSVVGGAALVWVAAILLVIQGGVGIVMSFMKN